MVNKLYKYYIIFMNIVNIYDILFRMGYSYFFGFSYRILFYLNLNT